MEYASATAGIGRPEFRRVVAISDTHFGEEGSRLSEPRNVEAFLGELEALGEIDLLVLLGDIWDLWRTGLREAHGAGRHFFRRLAEWRGARELALVAGNHDNHLALAYMEESLRRKMKWYYLPSARRGVIRQVAEPGPGRIPMTGFPLQCVLEIEGLPLRLAYPFLALRAGGRDVLLTHGHHLDFFSRSFWWAKTAWLARCVLGTSRGISLSDIDRLNRPFFELLTNTAVVPEIRRLEYRAYRVLRLLARLLRFHTSEGGSPRRHTTVGENVREALELLAGLLPGYLPDVFAFGHTHRAGLEYAPLGGRKVLLANTGCWLDGEEGDTPGTYLVLDEKVRLRCLSEWEVEASPEGDFRRAGGRIEPGSGDVTRRGNGVRERGFG
ncbi:MAG: metallophosphoesterase [Actinobacteria bacterium]|nr:metallophosphoesterase [Actinomycetota bacterium]